MLSVGSLLASVLQIFLLALLGRLIFDYVQMFSRTWRPKGIILYFVEAIYTITDPPMKFVGRFVPPLRLGGVSLDLSFIVLLIAIGLAKTIIVVIL
jgi:YggT family protein